MKPLILTLFLALHSFILGAQEQPSSLPKIDQFLSKNGCKDHEGKTINSQSNLKTDASGALNCFSKMMKDPEARKKYHKSFDAAIETLKKSSTLQDDPRVKELIEKKIKQVQVMEKIGVKISKLPPVIQRTIGKVLQRFLGKKYEREKQRVVAQINNTKEKIKEKIEENPELQEFVNKTKEEIKGKDLEEVVTLFGNKIPATKVDEALNSISSRIDSFSEQIQHLKKDKDKILSNLEKIEEIENNPEKAKKFNQLLSEKFNEQELQKIKNKFEKLKESPIAQKFFKSKLLTVLERPNV